ncbi:MAG: protein kinase [Chloroflexi bacterium]|nr:protein kinase [Chloroflexota bacterium]MCI0578043.1 protein kinase [Chloroflexota bacterium]MCI0644743.1 protein kinase [Chloroflexota bacterium]MCI0728648.1 protein kinase [Chloroflexota bacterium]
MDPKKVVGGRFEIEDPDRELLGQGGIGIVYRGLDCQTNQTVAIKVLKPHLVTSQPDLVARFIREGEALRQLNHPSIVKMIAAIQEEEQYYLVMEYVGGGSLAELLKREVTLPIPQVVEIALDLADALTRAHRLGIIHRDLKPANVLLAEDGTPRLTDFGAARLQDGARLTQFGTVLGTRDYLSPEVCSGRQLDERADIWALGVMIYEMLTGGRPFSGLSLQAVLQAILYEPTPDPARFRPDVPDALADLVYRMLTKDPQERIPSARLVGAELEALLKGWDTPSRPAHRPIIPYPEERFATPTSSQVGVRHHNLPAQTTPFVGRTRELAELDRLLNDPGGRLVTILGPGGMGKTRLALQAAEEQLERFDHGVYFVPLASLQAGAGLAPAVAEALDFAFSQEGGPAWQQLLDYLREKQLLLILDNFEHLLESAGVVSELLQTAPHVKLLVTSRIRLNVQGEQLYQLDGLSFPQDSAQMRWETAEDGLAYNAVELFVQSARRVRPTFNLADDNWPDVARICRLVEGVPLGVILAAGWVEVLSPAEVADEINQGLDFLATELQDVPERQRSMRAVLDYSWNLLNEREQHLFSRLAVFRGGFTREAAQAVTGVSLRELMALVNKSLLQRSPTGRYEVHELLRQYAAEKLEQLSTAVTAHDRHSAYFCELLKRLRPELRDGRQVAALAQLDLEAENCRAAWFWAVLQQEVDRLIGAASSLSLFYEYHNRYEDGLAVSKTASSRLATPTSAVAQALRGKVLVWQAFFNRRLGQGEAARECLAQAQPLLDAAEAAGQEVRWDRTFLLAELGRNLQAVDRQRALHYFAESLSLAESIGDDWEIANSLIYLGRAAIDVGDYDQARQQLERSQSLFQGLGDPRGMARTLNGLGVIALIQGRIEEAERLLRQSFTLSQELGDKTAIASRLFNLGTAIILEGRFIEAHEMFEESIDIYRELGIREGLALSTACLVVVETHMGRYDEGSALGRKGLALSREINSPRGISLCLLALSAGPLCRGAYLEARELLLEGIDIYRHTDVQNEFGIALACLGETYHRLGELAEARPYLAEAIQVSINIRSFWPLTFAVAAAASFAASSGDPERAVELYALASRHPLVQHSQVMAEMFGRHVAEQSAHLPPELVAAAQTRGRARSWWMTAAELAAELAQDSARDR